MCDRSKTLSARTTSDPAMLLLILFIALKLCRVIDWSWWWVMAPLWVPAALVTAAALLLLLVYGAVILVGACVEWSKPKWSK